MLARHGETDENTQKLMQGQWDTELNAEGRKQASQLADELSVRYPDIKAIYSSDLKRAYDTAAKAAHKLGLQVILDPHFKEISWGAAERVLIKDTAELITPEFKVAWGKSRQERWSYPIFPGSESYNDVLKRAQEGLKLLAQQHPGETLVIFTHSRVIKVLVQDALDDDREEACPLYNGSLASFTYNSESPHLRFNQIETLITAQH